MADRGWVVIGPHPEIAGWATAALPLAVQVLAQTDQPLRCGGTWAVGLDLLGNDPEGSVAGVALPWKVLGVQPQPLHKAQISAVYPGYPRQSPPDAPDAETPAAFDYRRKRDSAHLDGLLPIGAQRARMVKEPHDWILGIALTDCGAGASPLVGWQGSHRIMAKALRSAFAGHSEADWANIDVTQVYQDARREVFEACTRVQIPLRPGQAVLCHRHLLHGVAPWQEGAIAPVEGRLIAYFRPLAASMVDWMRPC